MKISTALASAVFALAAAGTASAATFTINFNGLAGQQPSYNVNVGGLTNLLISADEIDRSGGSATLREQIDVEVNASEPQGIGVVDPGDGSTDVDGAGDPNALIFSFGRSVTLIDILFDNIDSDGGGAGDEAILAGLSGDPGGSSFGVTNYVIDPTGGDDGTLPASFAGLTGSFFVVGAGDSDDDFRVQSLTIEISAIPLPSTALLLLAGVGGLAAMRRRK